MATAGDKAHSCCGSGHLVIVKPPDGRKELPGAGTCRLGIRNPGDDLVWSAIIATPNLPLHELRAGC